MDTRHMTLASRYSRLIDSVFGDDESLVHAPNEDPSTDRADNYLVARGDSLFDDDEAKLESQLPGVPDDAWTQFVRAMIVAPLSSVSPSNGLGLFDITPRRLADLGVVRQLERGKSPKPPYRTIYVAVFVPPMTPEKFLGSPSAQYKCFSESICHRAGPSGLESWRRENRYPATELVYTRVAGVF